MKKLWPYLLVTLVFALILNLSQSSHRYVNTHDEDDNIVSGYLMSRNGYKLGRDIFSHHLPGAYLLSEELDRIAKPEDTIQSVDVHRDFVVIWNYVWALLIVATWGWPSVWLVLMVELARSVYLLNLFHAENLVMYPLVYLLLTLFDKQKIKPFWSGLTSGLLIVFLAPLWPVVLLSGIQFLILNGRNYRKVGVWLVMLMLPILWVLWKIDIREFVSQFFGYNALTYAPMVIKKPWLFSLAAFLAPGMVLFDFSLSTKVIMIQLLVLFLFLFNFRTVKFKAWFSFGMLLGIIGFRSTPRFHNPALDFHILPWVVTLAVMCWYKYFVGPPRKNWAWLVVFVLPLVCFLWKPADYFPKQSEAGHMVIRYDDKSPVVNFLNSSKKPGDTLFALPAHTLLYQQTQIKPFNKFLFFLPWMEKSPLLYKSLMESFEKGLPTFIFIDSIHFPYFPPEEIRQLLENYREIKVADGEPPILVLKY